MRIAAILIVALVGVAAGYVGVSALRPAPETARGADVQPRKHRAQRHRQHRRAPKPATPAPTPAPQPVAAKPKPKPAATTEEAPSIAESVGKATDGASATENEGDIVMQDPDTGETTTVPADDGSGE